jgi:hypothetical protein
MKTAAVCLAALAGAAASAHATDRYWIAPIIGDWSSAANWSLSDGGPAGGGLPAPDDRVLFTERSICLLTGSILPAGTGFDSVRLQGQGSGTTVLQHSGGTLGARFFTVGRETPRNEYIQTGGLLSATFASIGFNPGGEGYAEIRSGAAAEFGFLEVGKGDADGHLVIDGGTVDVVLALQVSRRNTIDTGAGFGIVDVMGDAELIGGPIQVGADGPGTFNQSGGFVRATDFDVGLRPRLGSEPFSTLNATGGQLVADDQLAIGATRADETTDGAGRLIVDGGNVRADMITLGESAGADGGVTMISGVLRALDRLDIAAPGRGEVSQLGGSVVAGNLNLGVGNGRFSSTGLYTLTNGQIDVSDTLRMGAVPDSDARLTMTGGMIDTGSLILGGADDTQALFAQTGGEVLAGAVVVGAVPECNATMQLEGGSMRAGTFVVSQSPLLRAGVTITGGTLVADAVEINPDDRIGTTIIPTTIGAGGVLTTPILTITTGASARVVDTGDMRAGALTNHGLLRFEDGATLSGPLLGPPFNTRLIGTLTSTGELDVRSLTPSHLFLMNLINTGTFSYGGFQQSEPFVIRGRVENTGSIELDGSGVGNTSTIRVESVQGLTNDGTIALNDATIDLPNGPLTNNLALTGNGVIDGDLVNAGLVLAGANPGEIEITGDLTNTGSMRFTVDATGTPLNTVRLSHGDAFLAGEIQVIIDSGLPTPPPGTEYTLITADTGTINGNFAIEQVSGLPCEIVYEPTRVFARTLRCNAADLVAPFGILDLSDISAFTAAFMSGSTLADINGDSFLDLSDINAFVAAFSAGCP